MFYGQQWGFVCDSSSWTLQEASLVCKQLGFSRGVRSTTQGLVYGPIDEDRKITERVECQGHESKLDKCRIRYKNRAQQCNPQESIVAITCIHDTFALCDDSEVPWGNSCYSVHFNRSTFDKAAETCQSEGKKLIEVNAQEENDLLSELLLHSRYSPGVLAQVWTGGKARNSGARKALYYWQDSKTNIDCK